MTKAIIFDLNGTLDNTDEAFAKAFFLTLEKYLPRKKDRNNDRDKDLKIFAKELLAFFWQADKIADLKYPNWEMTDIIQFGVKNWAKFRNVKINIPQFSHDYNLIRKDELMIKPEFAKLIKSLSKDLLKFIFSQGNTKEDILRLLSKAGLNDNYFTEILTTKMFKEETKPSITILNHILNKYSLKPKECLLIADDVFLDLMPAKILGMKTVLVSNYVDNVAKDIYAINMLIKKK